MGILRRNYIYILCFLFAETGCWSVRDLKDFTLYRETSKVDPNTLKINGIYYSIQKLENVNQVDCFVLYENGTYLNLNGNRIDSDVPTAIESVLQHAKSYQKTFSTQISRWGAFKIASDTLLIQRFHHPASSNVFFTTVFNDRMKLLNDTTLSNIETEYKSNFDEYHLYKTKNKPDSTNLFTINKKIEKKLTKIYKKRHDKQ